MGAFSSHQDDKLLIQIRSDPKTYETYKKLVSMGFNDVLAMKTSKKYEGNIEKCVDYLSLQNNQETVDIVVEILNAKTLEHWAKYSETEGLAGYTVEKLLQFTVPYTIDYTLNDLCEYIETSINKQHNPYLYRIHSIHNQLSFVSSHNYHKIKTKSLITYNKMDIIKKGLHIKLELDDVDIDYNSESDNNDNDIINNNLLSQHDADEPLDIMHQNVMDDLSKPHIIDNQWQQHQQLMNEHHQQHLQIHQQFMDDCQRQQQQQIDLQFMDNISVQPPSYGL